MRQLSHGKIKPIVWLSALALLLLVFASLLHSPLQWLKQITTGTAKQWLPTRPHIDGQIERAIIIPDIASDDVEWLKAEALSSYVPVVYCMDEREDAACHVPYTQEGREAAAYLSYIVQYYDHLPRYNIFIHASAQQRHNDILGPLTVESLLALRYQAVDQYGYVNLRCTHDPGCPAGVTPLDPPEEDVRDNGPRARYADIYQELFNVSAAQVPATVGYVCCAQFVVTRDQIRKRSVEDYQRMLDWLAKPGNSDSHEKGWILETMWHIVFGQESVLCPRFEQCRCDLYGWCGPFVGGEQLHAVGS